MLGSSGMRVRVNVSGHIKIGDFQASTGWGLLYNQKAIVRVKVV
jgi:hypothetical protein